MKARLLPFLVRLTHDLYIEAGQAAAKHNSITVSNTLLQNIVDSLSVIAARRRMPAKRLCFLYYLMFPTENVYGIRVTLINSLLDRLIKVE